MPSAEFKRYTFGESPQCCYVWLCVETLLNVWLCVETLPWPVARSADLHACAYDCNFNSPNTRRYEALCIDTPAVLRRMLEFSGYQILPKSLECTLANHKCHSANAAMPVHRDLFTEGQVAKILDTQARSLEAYGYVWNATTTSLDLVNSPLLCEW
jgi:hypothetical protein